MGISEHNFHLKIKERKRENEKRNNKKKSCAGGEYMNPVFILLVLLGTVGLWFILAPIFYSLGKIFSGIYEGAKEEMNRDDKKEKKEE